MDAVYPATASALARGRRLRRAEPRHRHRTTPVTFAEIKEVDEESCEAEACEERGAGGGAAGPRRRPDVLEERLGAQFAEFRRRRANKRDVLREREHESPPPARAAPATPAPPAAQLARADSEPSALHREHADT
ncbi:uncharacterized protein LOC142980745 [Anticarsia gemmatalis]|uniref:uncharacterized protein LOC142980745 n=1 Tax=Anticarsia gemmatalis TaxID=129554 RepID=UPI003F7769B3